MTFFRHDGSAWEEDIFHFHDGSTWTDDNDEIYAHDGSGWVLIQPVVGVTPPDDDFPPPNTLDADPTDTTAEFTWVLPSSTPTPTEVQWRIAELSTVWDVLEYPATGASHQALVPDTTYTFQIRLVHRTDGVADVFSTVAELSFDTTETSAPLGPTEDTGGTGSDSHIELPIIGGALFPGTPGAVDSADCWWEYHVEKFTAAGFVALDPPIEGTYAGTAHVVPFNQDDLPNGSYRYCVREVCNGTPGAWHCGEPFARLEEWSDPCGIDESADASNEIGGFTDAVFFIPKVCSPDVVEDGVTGTALAKGSGFGGTFGDSEDEDDMNWQIGSRLSYLDSAAWHTMLTGNLTSIEDMLNSPTWSLSFRMNLGGSPLAGPVYLVWLGQNFVVMAKPHVSGMADKFTLMFQYRDADGLQTGEALVPTNYSFDTEYKITVRFDDAGGKELIVGTTQQALRVGDIGAVVSPTDELVVGLPQDAKIWNIAGWDRLLTDAEIAEELPGSLLLSSMVGWWDAKTYSGTGNLLNKGTAGSAGDMIPGGSPTFNVDHFEMDGVNDEFRTSGDVPDFNEPAKGTAFTVGVIVSFGAGTLDSIGSLFDKADSDSRPGWVLATAFASRAPMFFCSSATANYYVPVLASQLSVGQVGVLLGMAVPPATIVAQLNNSVQATIADGRTAYVTNSATTRIGVNQSANTWQIFHLHGAFIHQGALSAQDITDIGAYYGLTI